MLTGDSAALWDLYSINQAMQAEGDWEAPSSAKEIEFWQKKKTSGLVGLLLEPGSSEAWMNKKTVTFQGEMRLDTPAGPRTLYIVVTQVWEKQRYGWRIVANHREELSSVKRLKAEFAIPPVEKVKPMPLRCGHKAWELNPLISFQ